jgi:hypothetical protein
MISVSSYPHVSKKGQTDIWRSFKKSIDLIKAVKSEVKDYREVAMNLARKLRGG